MANPSFAQDAEKARLDGLSINTNPSYPRPPLASNNSCESSSSKNSAHPLQSPPDHLAAPQPFPPGGISAGQRGVANPTSYSADTSVYSSEDSRRANKQRANAIAWLYDYNGGPEDDDWLHVPGVERDQGIFSKAVGCCSISTRGLFNLGALVVLASGLLMLFAGYPILRHFLVNNLDRKAASFFGLGGTNGSGQVPLLPGLFALIDPDTPAKQHSWKNPVDGTSFHLVFSDEFETEGRTFWPGDDPFWEAVDLHYWVTGDYEWYSPEAINTTDGFLNVWMTEKTTHNLNFQSGMLQSWNKFCFQGGYVETSVILPGSHSDEGFWPAVWMLGNLGRAGYAGTTQGMWPYSYNECDVGTLANQTNPQKTGPNAAINAHGLYSDSVDNKISFLEGQRVSACTCPGEDHPGPRHDVGRSSPEIDVFETQVYNGHGSASQSFQIAPFDANYSWSQNPDVAQIHSPDTSFNTYTGGIYQEAVSAITKVPDTAYMHSGAVPVQMGVKWDPDWKGDGSGSITWFLDGKPSWSVSGNALGPNKFTEIGQRLIPTEPVSIVINLALSDGFQKIHWNQIDFPAVMKLDYIRVYQRDGQEDKITCDPDDHPTAKYIQDHIDVYSNINYTVFPQEKYAWPKNKFLGEC
ncbi:related to KRE6 - glucan synthase subunit [Ustilago trichophora]|uniref:Related to KRE6 - glucan synthase subunit n=1 Tax=Ustilago trichophora TaxID=86804 RepID=A0A5C3E4D3_9BASI|nr:related to KRE6 - glucan synthase subunit [Ustilago trichophora]